VRPPKEVGHSGNLQVLLGGLVIIGAMFIALLVAFLLTGCKFSDLELRIKEAAVTAVTDYPSTNDVEKVDHSGGSVPP